MPRIYIEDGGLVSFSRREAVTMPEMNRGDEVNHISQLNHLEWIIFKQYIIDVNISRNMIPHLIHCERWSHQNIDFNIFMSLG